LKAKTKEPRRILKKKDMERLGIMRVIWGSESSFIDSFIYWGLWSCEVAACNVQAQALVFALEFPFVPAVLTVSELVGLITQGVARVER
jgi:hypothetical protein